MNRGLIFVLLATLLAGAGSFAKAQTGSREERVTFGAQCQFDDGRRASLIAGRQDSHFLMFRQVDGGWEMIRFEVAKDGALIFPPDAGDQQNITAWRDAFAVLKKLPMLTIKADGIRAFQAATDVPACGRSSFDWRSRQSPR